jgi:HK97 family phage major capsid protein
VNAILKPEGNPFTSKLAEFRHALQSEGTPSAGGYTVPTDTMKLIADDIRDNGITLGKVSVIPVGTNLIKLPTLSTVLTPEYTEEGAQKPVVNYTFGVTTFTIKKYSFIIPFTDELLEDSSSDLEAYLRQNIGEYYGILLDNILFRGDTQISGLYGLNTTFQPTSGTGFSSVEVDDLINAVGLLRTVDLKGAEWYMAPSVWAHLHTKKDEQGRYLLSEYDIKNKTLLGIPVTLTDSAYAMSETGADKPFITLGNLKKVYMAMRAGMTMSRSNEASFNDGNTQRSAFQDNLTLFRTEMRFDLQAPFASRIVQIKTAAV